jgi:hypothetical protein
MRVDVDRLGREIASRVGAATGYVRSVEVLVPVDVDAAAVSRAIELHLAELGLDRVEVSCVGGEGAEGGRLEKVTFEDQWAD